MYDDGVYANSRLGGTYVRSGSSVFYVEKVFPDFSVRGYRGTERVELKLSDLNLEPFPLGFYKINRLSYCYLSRIPKRRDWKQGIHTGNIHQYWDHIDALAMSKLQEMVDGKYPSLSKAIIDSRGGGVIAFDRRWGIKDGHRLVYRWHIVGSMSEDLQPTFLPQFDYLLSRFKEDFSHVGKKSTKATSKASN